MTFLRTFSFAAAIALLAVAPASAQPQWVLPSAYPADNFHSENLAAFARDLAEATGGRLTVTVQPNATLFPATAIKSAVRIGRAQMGEILISLHDNEDPIYGVDVVPFLAVSYDEARRLWAASRPAIERRFAAQGLVVLFAVPWPPQGIYSKKQINQIADMKGLSWRVYNSGTQRIAQLVDAYPVTIQAADLPQALATGLINAFISSSATGVDSKAWDTMNYFYDAQAWIPKNVTFMNKATFDQLDQPMQDMLLRTAAAAEARGWQLSQERTRWYLDQLGGNGMKVLPPSDTLKAGLLQIGERLTNEWLAKAGADGQALVEAYRKPSL
ncbi:MAG: TRAP transporter substrate-binding protein [Hyphomicrobiales bacterium]|nr:TRAP transporter substrate-binding protein [Hyphomicrobiales bacterium]